MQQHTSEAEYLRTYDPTAFDRPSVAVDVVLLAPRDGGLCTVLALRDEHPDKGRWAVPGGFVRMDESLDAAAQRVLRDKAGLRGIFLEQLYTFGAPKRDPRMRIISVAYYALVDVSRLKKLSAGATVAQISVPWSGESGGPVIVHDNRGKALPLAFDHAEMIGTAVKRVRGKLDYAPIAFELLPATFTLHDLQRVHEAVQGHKLNKDSFRRRVLASGTLEATGTLEEAVGHRPAALYQRKAPHG